MADKGIFRSDESFEAERITRSMVPDFLASRGFTGIRDDSRSYGKTVQQIVHAQDQEGRWIAAHVRLCWRREASNERQRRYSATQLLSKVENGKWIETLEKKVGRDQAKGVTHTLVIQREGGRISDAVLIPISQLVGVWAAQRDASERLIAGGRYGRKRKNHAMNGSSPTLWLHDEQAPELRQALLAGAGVMDLFALEASSAIRCDDTFDDLASVTPEIGSDGAQRFWALRSQVKRDPKVRKEVIDRAKGKCERQGCDEARGFAGFLDVHHIFGVDTSDLAWTCVALCPNCHREAHFSPACESLNEELAVFAAQFSPSASRTPA